MVTAPATGTVLLVDYFIGGTINNIGTNSYIADEAVTGSVNGSNAVFTTARPYIAGSLEVYVNGVKQAKTLHITETSPSVGTFTLDSAPQTGDIVRVAYQFNLNPASNSDTVDGIHASATPQPNQLLPLGSDSRLPRAAISQPHYIQLKQNSTQSINSTGSVIDLSSLELSSGTLLTQSTNTVVVGSGVTRVRVSYVLMSDTGTTAPYLFSRIRKNGVDISQMIDGSTSGFKATSETKMISVGSGDVIAIYADSGGGSLSIAAARLSYMLVEVVE
jgi:hypothetical protein